jgi:hypothetical protein
LYATLIKSFLNDLIKLSLSIFGAYFINMTLVSETLIGILIVIIFHLRSSADFKNESSFLPKDEAQLEQIVY